MSDCRDACDGQPSLTFRAELLTMFPRATKVAAGGGGSKRSELELRHVKLMDMVPLGLERGCRDAEWSWGTPVGCRVRGAAR